MTVEPRTLRNRLKSGELDRDRWKIATVEGHA